MGKRFRFRLEKVLNYRKGLEEEGKQKMMRVNLEYRRVEGDILGLRKDLEGIRLEGGMVEWMDGVARVCEGYRVRIGRKEEELGVLRKKLDELNRVYTKLKKEVKVLELLKEKSWRDYKVKLGNEEQHEEDEAFSKGGLMGLGKQKKRSN